MRYALLIAALVGCYSPSYSDCTVTCARTCPSGLECDSEGYCRTAGFTSSCAEVLGDSGVVNDRDSDRVPDASDNCPDVANPDQANEDGDATGDACDLCPIMSSTQQPIVDLDSDGDGIGNGCDPNGNLNTDMFLVFDGFNDQPVNGQLYGTTAFSFNGGKAIATPVYPDYSEIIWAPPAYVPSAYDVYIYAGFTVDSLPANASTLGAGVAEFTGPGAGVGCVVGAMQTQPGVYNVQIAPDSDQGGANGSFPIDAGTRAMVVFQSRHDGQKSCQVTFGAQNVVLPNDAALATLPGPALGLHVRGMSASFDYVYIVQSAAM